MLCMSGRGALRWVAFAECDHFAGTLKPVDLNQKGPARGGSEPSTHHAEPNLARLNVWKMRKVAFE